MREHLTTAWQGLRRRPFLLAAIAASLVASLYFFVLASDRYVSEAHVMIQRAELSGGQSFDLSSILGGGGGAGKGDQLLLRDHLLSVDMLRRLDARLHLREHYSDTRHDIVSRMWFKDASMERFHDYYLTRVSVEYDDYSGVLVIKAQGYDPKFAHALASALVAEGEDFMNAMAHRIAQGQVTFLERQVNIMAERFGTARQELLAYQNRKGMASPQANAETIGAIVARLQAQRSDLETQRSSLQSYLVPTHSSIVQLNQQIAAIDRQLALEQAKVASPGGKALNRTIEEYQRLEMKAQFAQDIYKTALTALESGRIEATRTIKQMSVVQTPTLPEKSEEPRRFYEFAVFALVALLLAGVGQLIMAIVRDHKD